MLPKSRFSKNNSREPPCADLNWTGFIACAQDSLLPQPGSDGKSSDVWVGGFSFDPDTMSNQVGAPDRHPAAASANYLPRIPAQSAV